MFLAQIFTERTKPHTHPAIMNDLRLYFDTLCHLKPLQLRYRIFYVLRYQLRKVVGFQYLLSIRAKGKRIDTFKTIPSYRSWLGANRFEFLNLSHDFGSQVNWNFSGHGKLWAYNLNYFDYLQQPGMGKENGLRLISDFIRQSKHNREGLEPFPISLRAVNWIKFISYHNIDDAFIDASLFAQYRILADNLEYHLMGNHLLENGVALLWGAIYFNDSRLYTVAKKILLSEMEEQVLQDGAHFELSPMYQQIVLLRVLDCINLLRCVNGLGAELLPMFIQKGTRMIGWLQKLSFTNGDIPLFNDSARGIAPTTNQLMQYAGRLAIDPKVIPLDASGYRMYKKGKYEIVVDVGPIGPDYIPAHGHCDMLSFVLHMDGSPFIVDTGTSTYESGPRRHYERSTAAHNTVCVNGEEQSQIWGCFRVGRRAEIKILADADDQLVAQHNGFSRVHRRGFSMENNKIVIEDSLLPGGYGTARFHFAPGKTLVVDGNHIVCGSIRLDFQNAGKIWIEPYLCGKGFNNFENASCACAVFEHGLITKIKILK